MFSIQKDAHGRRLIKDSYYDQFYKDEIFLKYYDEGSRIITVYKTEFNIDNDPSVMYVLWNFDISSNTLYYDQVNDISPKKFQEWTGLSPTLENIRKYNVKPELLKYAPDKKLAPSSILMTETKWIFNCQSMGYLRYKVQRVIYIFYDMLASMG